MASRKDNEFKHWTLISGLKFDRFQRLLKSYGLNENTPIPEWPEDVLRAYNAVGRASDRARQIDYDKWFEWMQTQ